MWGELALGIDVTANPLEQSVTSELAFVQTVVANEFEREVESTLTFVGVATAVRDKFEDVESVLAFTQELGAEFDEELESEIAFVSDAVVEAEFHRSVSSPITFVQDHHVNIVNAEASSVLAFVQALNVAGPIYEGTGSGLNLTSTAHGAHNIEVDVQQFMPLYSVAGIEKPASASSAIVFVQTMFNSQTPSSALVFVQTVSAGKGAEAEHTLELEQEAIGNLILFRDLESTLNLKSTATYILERSCTEQNYSPFVGAGSGETTPPPTTMPTLGSNTLTLTWPYVTPTTTLVLRNPEQANKETLSFDRINRETRGGTLEVYADPNWPKAKTLSLEVQHLKQSQVDDLMAFFLDSLGQEIGLLDHENRQWRGIILTPDAEVTYVGRENRSVQFDFEGELV